MSKVTFEGSEWVSEDVKKAVADVPKEFGFSQLQETESTTGLIDQMNDSLFEMVLNMALFMLPILFIVFVV